MEFLENSIADEKAPDVETTPKFEDLPIGMETSGMMSVHNLSYVITSGPPFRHVTKTVLRNVNGVFKNGINAIMGPTGAGKSTLLDLLSNRRDLRAARGKVLIDAEPLGDDFNLRTGFVAQEDIVMGTLTVRENILFAANLKMAVSSKEDKKKCVDEIVQSLGLERCENTRIGNELFQGVSGGERKRCCIGMELVTKPKFIFLDEPTTGLDSSTALSVISLLKDISTNHNSTIILSIHQPRYSIFKYFDLVHLLSCFGQSIYHGPAVEAVSYFARHEMVCDRRENPFDFFLDLIIANSKLGPWVFETDDLLTQNFDEKSKKEAKTCTQFDTKESKNLVHIFQQSQEFNNLSEELSVIEKLSTIEDKVSNNRDSFKSATNLLQQFRYLSQRSLTNVALSPRVVIIPTIVSFLLACVFGWLGRDWKFDLMGFENLYGALFFMVIQPVMGNFPAIEILLNGQKFFLHETAKGYYSAFPYLASKFLSELILLCGIPALVFSVFGYVILRLKRELIPFFVFVGVNELGSLAACSLIFFITASVGNYGMATAIIPGILVVMLLFSGLFLNLADLHSLFKVFEYLSIPKNMLSLQASFQLTNTQFCGIRNFTLPENQNSLIANKSQFSNFYGCETGEQRLESIGIGIESLERLNYFIILALFPILLFPLTYFILRVKSRRKL